MTSFVSAMDSYATSQPTHPKQVGTNGNVEYGWSNDNKEKFVQFYFQLVRTDDHRNLEIQLRHLLQTSSNRDPETRHYTEIALLSDLYSLIGHTRDVIEGKGEYQLAFMQIYVWYQYFPKLAMRALTNFVTLDGFQPYGSWKDIKNFCEYVKQREMKNNYKIKN